MWLCYTQGSVPVDESPVLAMVGLDNQFNNESLLASRDLSTAQPRLGPPGTFGSIPIWHREIASTRNGKHGAKQNPSSVTTEFESFSLSSKLLRIRESRQWRQIHIHSKKLVK
jgi:hypothetical protein